jgi:hypothetical protein
MDLEIAESEAQDAVDKAKHDADQDRWATIADRMR